ncbi:hypothetical protein Q5W_18010 [Hydrogenophaga sp. PBC]|uniref:helix-turn-helix transcriptional regulator n=1 Tax=Hydrogenophaga sp. PBC TaxID=795665 RepID=UPI000854176B|nr:helix-turn-helix transcriptional regulator [Hydrogenophaga sp. PBC]AOS80722.1 hypothetical protein Q5W_18010 [Hydrogenophaga sp. PBC]
MSASAPSGFAGLDDLGGPLDALEPLMDALVARVRERGFSGVAFVRPDPFGAAGARPGQALSSPPLQAHADWIERATPPRDQAVALLPIEALGEEGARRLGGLGYQQVLVVRVPVLGEACCEFWLFSTSTHVREEHLGAATLDLLRDWPAWREALRAAVCPLTPREREVLQAVAEGLKGAEAQERFGYTERTFRLHVENAKRKMRAANGSQAVYRAHLMCGL